MRLNTKGSTFIVASLSILRFNQICTDQYKFYYKVNLGNIYGFSGRFVIKHFENKCNIKTSLHDHIWITEKTFEDHPKFLEVTYVI